MHIPFSILFVPHCDLTLNGWLLVSQNGFELHLILFPLKLRYDNSPHIAAFAILDAKPITYLLHLYFVRSLQLWYFWKGLLGPFC